MSSAESTAVASYDVLVVGAGPAGCAAAITLARGGRRVVVVDKARFPRDKCCGDGLTTLALRELAPLGLRPEHVPNWQAVGEVWLRSPSGREVRLALPAEGTFAATAPRRELDAALVQLAREAGATVHEGCTLTAVRTLSDRVEVDIKLDVEVDIGAGGTSDHEIPGTLTAGHLVAADGVWSPTRKLLGLGQPGYLGEWHAFRQYVGTVTGPAAHRLYVWFEPDMLPGYAWSFPLPGGRANIGFGVLRGGPHTGKSMAAQWAGLIERPHIRAALGPDAQLEGRHTALPIPAAIDRAVLTHGRVLFVGDAARATDVMTGEGIGQALLTGRLAAEAIRAGNHGQEAAGKNVAAAYERAVRGELFADHRLSKILNGWLARPLLTRGAVRVVGLTAWTRRNFVRWMFEDEHRAIVFTPRRWHRRFLKRPAPYR
jgi:geranylgeranyl reductase family protein